MKLNSISVAGVSAVLFAAILSTSVQLGATEKDNQATAPADGIDKFVQCNTPRPEICYELYQPVCAKRDTGIRCITTPCPSTELITYSNDCKACADPAVLGFMDGGACQESSIATDLIRPAGT